LSHRCGFCERACYPQDAAEVIIEGGVHTWGCCSHCALGVAARTGKNIEVREKDRLTDSNRGRLVRPAKKNRRIMGFRRLLPPGLFCQSR